MSRFAAALCLAALACGGQASPKAPTPLPAPDLEPPEPANQSPPELVEKKGEPAPTDCVAAGPDGGLLDRTSPVYKRIEFTQDAQSISETAWLRSSEAIVTTRIGGCAHFGASWTVQMPSSVPLSDRAHHLKTALELVNGLPKRAGAVTYLDNISTEISGAIGDPDKLEECSFPRGEMDTVYCSITQEDGLISIVLSLDIVL